MVVGSVLSLLAVACTEPPLPESLPEIELQPLQLGAPEFVPLGSVPIQVRVRHPYPPAVAARPWPSRPDRPHCHRTPMRPQGRAAAPPEPASGFPDLASDR